MPHSVKAVYHKGVFVPQEPCNIPEGLEVELIRLLATFGEAGRRGRARGGAGSELWMAGGWSSRQEEALGQQIKPGSAIHLALEQLQAVDVPFDWSLTPR